MELAFWVRVVLIFHAGCHGILLWRLSAEKLTGSYLYLTIYLAAEMIQDLALLPFRLQTNAYLMTYLFSAPAIWILAYLVVLELYGLILEDYPGISSAGRKAVKYSMALAVLISAIYAIPDLRNTNGPFPIIRIYAVVERSTVLGLLLFLALIQLFLFHYRLRLSRNRMVYATGYAVYFGVAIGQDIVLTALGIRVGAAVSLWTVAVSGAILLAGAAVLNRAGEVVPVLTPESPDSDRARLQQQLTDMNRLLMRAARGRG